MTSVYPPFARHQPKTDELYELEQRVLAARLGVADLGSAGRDDSDRTRAIANDTRDIGRAP